MALPDIGTLSYTTLFRSLLKNVLAAGNIGVVVQKTFCGALFGCQKRFDHSSLDRKSTRLNSSHRCISYAVFCLKKKRLPSIVPLITMLVYRITRLQLWTL